MEFFEVFGAWPTSEGKYLMKGKSGTSSEGTMQPIWINPRSLEEANVAQSFISFLGYKKVCMEIALQLKDVISLCSAEGWKKSMQEERGSV